MFKALKAVWKLIFLILCVGLMNNPKIDNSICSKRKIDITLKLYSVAVFFKFNGLVNFFLLLNVPL